MSVVSILFRKIFWMRNSRFGIFFHIHVLRLNVFLDIPLCAMCTSMGLNYGTEMSSKYGLYWVRPHDTSECFKVPALISLNKWFHLQKKKLKKYSRVKQNTNNNSYDTYYDVIKFNWFTQQKQKKTIIIMPNEEKKSHTLPYATQWIRRRERWSSINQAHSLTFAILYVFLVYEEKKGINHRRHSTPPVMQHSNTICTKNRSTI